jgi:glycogen phosphorylase
MTNSENVRIAYFSMEITLDPAIPTYSGGLGVLAGDMLRSAADIGLPMTAVTLVHRKGYFRHHLDTLGNQTEEADVWHPEEVLARMDPLVSVSIEGRPVAVRAWRFVIRGISGHEVPVYLLDTDLPENSAWDRTLTDSLYGGDDHYRLCQEVVLGIGGVEMLQSLGLLGIQSYHMNEGHSALLTLALLERRLGNSDLGTATDADIDVVRRQCIFTTHTPVPAGQDQFPRELASRVLGADRIAALEVTQCCPEQILNMTYLALRFAHYINGVAMHHGDISRTMFPHYPVHAITNGVHAVTWTSAPFRELYDRHIPEWRQDNSYLRYAVGIPAAEIRETHAQAKGILLEEVKKSTGIELDKSAMTIGFARRAATYKRADLLLSEPERLRWMIHNLGPMQVLYGGKAHPRDQDGRALIRKIFEDAVALKDSLRVVYIANYDTGAAAARPPIEMLIQMRARVGV